MKPKWRRLLLAFFLAVPAMAVTPEAKAKKTAWTNGTVIDVDVYGQGAKSGVKDKKGQPTSSRKDLWWTYHIGSGEKTYLAVLRKSPAKSGLQISAPVRYYVSRGRLYLLNPKGKRFELRILRQETAEVRRE